MKVEFGLARVSVSVSVSVRVRVRVKVSDSVSDVWLCGYASWTFTYHILSNRYILIKYTSFYLIMMLYIN